MFGRWTWSKSFHQEDQNWSKWVRRHESTVHLTSLPTRVYWSKLWWIEIGVPKCTMSSDRVWISAPPTCPQGLLFLPLYTLKNSRLEFRKCDSEDGIRQLVSFSVPFGYKFLTLLFEVENYPFLKSQCNIPRIYDTSLLDVRKNVRWSQFVLLPLCQNLLYSFITNLTSRFFLSYP